MPDTPKPTPAHLAQQIQAAAERRQLTPVQYAHIHRFGQRAAVRASKLQEKLAPLVEAALAMFDESYGDEWYAADYFVRLLGKDPELSYLATGLLEDKLRKAAEQGRAVFCETMLNL